MSRNSETIEEVIDEISHKPGKKIEDITKNIVLRLLEKHEYTSKVEVILNGILILDVLQESKGKVQKSIDVNIKTIGIRNMESNKNHIYQYLTITIVGMTACPCGQELSRDYAKTMLVKRKDELKLNEEIIDNILNLVPMATHSQRCNGTIMIEIPQNFEIDLLTLVDIIERSMSGITYNILKRPDEGKLIRYSHLNPRFVEDCIRLIALNIYKKYKNLPEDIIINLKVESFESIHSYNAIAEINSTIGKLKQIFEE